MPRPVIRTNELLYKYPQRCFSLRGAGKGKCRPHPAATRIRIARYGYFRRKPLLRRVCGIWPRLMPTTCFFSTPSCNRGPEAATLHVLPQLWFRNTWSWGYNDYRPSLQAAG
ncbi:MAG: hypothetical protein WKG07_32105 [Hymenobacter sp.]